jgi:hypothetical protein
MDKLKLFLCFCCCFFGQIQSIRNNSKLGGKKTESNLKNVLSGSGYVKTNINDCSLKMQ